MCNLIHWHIHDLLSRVDSNARQFNAMQRHAKVPEPDKPTDHLDRWVAELARLSVDDALRPDGDGDQSPDAGEWVPDWWGDGQPDLGLLARIDGR